MCKESFAKFIEYCTKILVILEVTCDGVADAGGAVAYSSCLVWVNFLILGGNKSTERHIVLLRTKVLLPNIKH